MAKTEDRPKGASRVDRYLPRWAIEEVLRAMRREEAPPPMARPPSRNGPGRPWAVAEVLEDGGCVLHRLLRAPAGREAPAR